MRHLIITLIALFTLSLTTTYAQTATTPTKKELKAKRKALKKALKLLPKEEIENLVNIAKRIEARKDSQLNAVKKTLEEDAAARKTDSLQIMPQPKEGEQVAE